MALGFFLLLPDTHTRTQKRMEVKKKFLGVYVGYAVLSLFFHSSIYFIFLPGRINPNLLSFHEPFPDCVAYRVLLLSRPPDVEYLALSFRAIDRANKKLVDGSW